MGVGLGRGWCLGDARSLQAEAHVREDPGARSPLQTRVGNVRQPDKAAQETQEGQGLTMSPA